MTTTSIGRQRLVTVLMTADTVGGVWSYSVRLCASLPSARFVLATMGPRATELQRREIDRLGNVVLAESDYRLEWMAGAAADFAESQAWLCTLARQHGVDVVHVNGYAHADLGIGRPVLVIAHSDVLSWWQAVCERAAPPEWEGYRKKVVAGLTAATRIVAPTAAVIRDVERHYVRLKARVELIPNGIDPQAFTTIPKRAVVTAAGRVWDAAKNLKGLEAVAPGLDWPVEIAGDSKHPESGVAHLANVRLLGRLSPVEMARQLAGASIFAAPARYEPFGLAILEAAAAGCALVLGDIPSLRENWDAAAVFVDPDDRTTLRAAINRLIANTGDRVRLAQAAQRRARQFTMDRMAKAYAALYREVARKAVRLESV